MSSTSEAASTTAADLEGSGGGVASDRCSAAPMSVGIVGYTASRLKAPQGDPEWDLWGLNNLHLAPDIDTSKFGAWYDLHDLDTIRSDAPHVEWLEGGADGLPVWVWEPQAEWPTSQRFPVEQMLASFPRYFTNSVSWMTAHAIVVLTERATAQGRPLTDCTLGVWGIDMATGGEYAAQRPSCEFFLGVAMGLGIRVELPDSSDLLKAGVLYGAEKPAMLAKIVERKGELAGRMQQLRQEHDQLSAQMRSVEANLNAGQGALDQLTYIEQVWFQPERAANSTHASTALAG